MAKTKKTVESMLTDPAVPFEMKQQMLIQLLSSDDKEAPGILARVLEKAAAAAAGEHFIQKTQELDELIAMLQQAPMRCAHFVRVVDTPGLGRRAEVVLRDGGAAFCIAPNEELLGSLRCGDTVWLEASGGTLLFHQPDRIGLGEELTIERWLPDGNVELAQGELGRYVCRPSAELLEQNQRGEAEAGMKVIACTRRLLAFTALPGEKGVSGMRFLSREPVPDVVLERDVGAPAPFIREFANHVEREMTTPELARRYRVRRSRMLLATGVPGSGKTLSIHALWRLLYQTMSDLTGVAIDALPQRVMQLRGPDVLSKWLGNSDRNIKRFFRELGQLAEDSFVAPDGREWELPVLVVLEEIDALARQRGEDAIHDRIQTTLLNGLDPAQSLFRDRLVLVICTTNLPGVLDAAFRRRAAGSVAHFGRLDRFAFKAIAEKLLRDLPFASDEGDDVARRAAATELGTWLFAPNVQTAGAAGGGLVELTYVGQPAPVTKHRRDFLTAGLIDRAVQQTCYDACEAEWNGAEDPGITSAQLMCAIDAQVRHIVDQLTPANCEHYLTLPDATRVASVRRLPQPPVLTVQLERAS